MTKPIVSLTTPNGPIIEPKTGTATFAFLKWMQNIGQTINNAFDQQGALSPDSIPFPTSSALGGVTTAGPIGSEWINEIDDQGVPHLKQPNYSDLAGTLPNPSLNSLGGVKASTAVASQWGNAISPSGVLQTSQPGFSDIAGAATAAQVPNLSDLNGQITDAQLPADGISATIATAKLTLVGADGSMTFVNGILTAQVPAT